MKDDIVIPLFQPRWCTRAVFEGVSQHYSPRKIHVICPEKEVSPLERQAEAWQTSPIEIHSEDTFFESSFGLGKSEIGAILDLENSLYTPGWFYQQILKLGASDGIEDLSDNFLIWDSDLLPVKAWPVVIPEDNHWPYRFALLQACSHGNEQIIERWATWISKVLSVPAVEDSFGTFVPHHMWFNRSIVGEIKTALKSYYNSDAPWPLLMMKSANEFGTFSEFWLYSSWLATKHPEKLRFYPYETYGATTERFFDDGSGRFSEALRAEIGRESIEGIDYQSLSQFIQSVYTENSLPSSLSFESSPRHKKKGSENMHVEELRSRWHLAD